MPTERSVTPLRIWFWFGTKGDVRVLERWREAQRAAWRKRNPGCMSPTGTWRKVQPGHFLRRILGTDNVLNEIVKVGNELWKDPSLRRIFSSATERGQEAADYPGYFLTLARLWESDFGDYKLEGWSEDETRLLRLWMLLVRGTVLPCPYKGRMGWLVACPDETTAAAWELALMHIHNLRRQFRALLRDKFPPPKKPRQKTPKSLFLGHLRVLVHRGKLSQAQRDSLKAVMDQKGVEAARKAVEEILEKEDNPFARSE